VPGGIALQEAVAATAMLARNPRLVAAEIVEYNPFRDPGRRTAAAVVAIAAALRGTDKALAKPRRAA
jgi:arginase family enzyme